MQGGRLLESSLESLWRQTNPERTASSEPPKGALRNPLGSRLLGNTLATDTHPCNIPQLSGKGKRNVYGTELTGVGLSLIDVLLRETTALEQLVRLNAVETGVAPYSGPYCNQDPTLGDSLALLHHSP